MHTWIVQTGEPLPIDGPDVRGMRAMNLAKALIERGHEVTIWSTDFYHQEKRHRFGEDRSIEVSPRLTVRLISSIGYRRNLGPRRFADHLQLGLRFDRLASSVKPADVAFIGFPPVEIAAASVAHCQRRSIPCILDVKDLWPDLFEDPLPGVLKPLARGALMPLHSLTRRAIQNCDGICAPSPGFLGWAHAKGGVGARPADFIAPLTVPSQPVQDFDRGASEKFWDQLGVMDDGRPRATFVGTMSRSFDFECILRAARAVRGLDWQWVLCGDGESMDQIRTMARGLRNVVLPGWIDRTRIDCLLARSTVGLAPYRSIPNFELNICNKVYDYLSCGIPVISPLRGDVRTLLEQARVGGWHEPGDPDQLLEAMNPFRDAITRAEMSRNASRIFDERFEPQAAYSRLVMHLEGLVSRPRDSGDTRQHTVRGA